MNPPCNIAESLGFNRQHEHSAHGQTELFHKRSLQVVSLLRTDPFLKNDAIAIFVDGVNIAWVGSPNKPVCVFEVNGTRNSTFFRTNDESPNHFFNLQYDGFTSTTAHPWLTATKNVTVGVPVHIKIVIADEDDGLFDSAVFLKAKRPICP